MNAKEIISLAVAIALLPGAIILAEENENDTKDWISKHAKVKTTETIELDASGNIRSLQRVKDTTVHIRQTLTEIQKPDNTGGLKTISRITTSSDTLGGSATITESLLPGNSTLITTAITTVEKTAEGMLTTVYARNKTGKMAVVSRTTTAIVEDR